MIAIVNKLCGANLQCCPVGKNPCNEAALYSKIYPGLEFAFVAHYSNATFSENAFDQWFSTTVLRAVCGLQAPFARPLAVFQ